MAIQIPTNFDVRDKLPLDDRMVVTDRTTVASDTSYVGMIVWDDDTTNGHTPGLYVLTDTDPSNSDNWALVEGSQTQLPDYLPASGSVTSAGSYVLNRDSATPPNYTWVAEHGSTSYIPATKPANGSTYGLDVDGSGTVTWTTIESGSNVPNSPSTNGNYALNVFDDTVTWQSTVPTLPGTDGEYVLRRSIGNFTWELEHGSTDYLPADKPSPGVYHLTVGSGANEPVSWTTANEVYLPNSGPGQGNWVLQGNSSTPTAYSWVAESASGSGSFPIQTDNQARLVSSTNGDTNDGLLTVGIWDSTASTPAFVDTVEFKKDNTSVNNLTAVNSFNAAGPATFLGTVKMDELSIEDQSTQGGGLTGLDIKRTKSAVIGDSYGFVAFSDNDDMNAALIEASKEGDTTDGPQSAIMLRARTGSTLLDTAVFKHDGADYNGREKFTSTYLPDIAIQTESSDPAELANEQEIHALNYNLDVFIQSGGTEDGLVQEVGDGNDALYQFDVKYRQDDRNDAITGDVDKYAPETTKEWVIRNRTSAGAHIGERKEVDTFQGTSHEYRVSGQTGSSAYQELFTDGYFVHNNESGQGQLDDIGQTQWNVTGLASDGAFENSQYIIQTVDNSAASFTYHQVQFQEGYIKLGVDNQAADNSWQLPNSRGSVNGNFLSIDTSNGQASWQPAISATLKEFEEQIYSGATGEVRAVIGDRTAITDLNPGTGNNYQLSVVTDTAGNFGSSATPAFIVGGKHGTRANAGPVFQLFRESTDTDGTGVVGPRFQFNIEGHGASSEDLTYVEFSADAQNASADTREYGSFKISVRGEDGGGSGNNPQASSLVDAYQINGGRFDNNESRDFWQHIWRVPFADSTTNAAMTLEGGSGERPHVVFNNGTNLYVDEDQIGQSLPLCSTASIDGGTFCRVQSGGSGANRYWTLAVADPTT